ncbi:uncharacterized protein EAF02_000382 [Botrytis sinoallii]|uniref:uncharacterized protein n=1 Tax=Botrytis sinoallii TaxID=1463999 RepID=UPI001902B731|nr:uncharacterized protein EAF02_000382 [Botrytis sinoallii]KAF7892844.1 hypothetical protein EAF02_000382 [Botrytis sinoallii]
MLNKIFTRPAPPVIRSQLNPLVLTAVVTTIGAFTYYSISDKKTEQGTSNQQSPPKTFGGGPAFTSLQLHSVEKLNHDSSRFRFRLPTEDSVSGLSLISSLLTLTKPAGQWRPVVRPYTPISDLNVPGYVDLVIKRYPGGQASQHIHSLKPGDSLFFLAALGGYKWKQNEFNHIVMIAGGAGITPMAQLLKGIFSNPSEKTKVTLLFGINTDEDALFRSEFDEIAKTHPDRFSVVYTVTHPGPDSVFLKGRVTKELIKDALSKTSNVPEKVFVCGPPAMEASLLGERNGSQGILKELGFGKDQIYKC